MAISGLSKLTPRRLFKLFIGISVTYSGLFETIPLHVTSCNAPLVKVTRYADVLFKVNPLFDAAWNAINSLDIHDVEEIRSYRTPPVLVTLVVDAICLMFEKEQT